MGLQFSPRLADANVDLGTTVPGRIRFVGFNLPANRSFLDRA